MSPQKNHTKMLAEVSKVPPLPVGRVDLLYEHPFRGGERGPGALVVIYFIWLIRRAALRHAESRTTGKAAKPTAPATAPLPSDVRRAAPSLPKDTEPSRSSTNIGRRSFIPSLSQLRCVVPRPCTIASRRLRRVASPRRTCTTRTSRPDTRTPLARSILHPPPVRTG